MTTDMFIKRAKSLRAALPFLAPRPAPGINVQMSKDVGLPVAVPVPAAMSKGGIAPPPFAGTAVDVIPTPKPADVEDVRLGYKFQMQEIRIGTHSTQES